MHLINLTYSDLKFFSDKREYLGLLPSKVKTKDYPVPYVSAKKKKVKSIGNAVIYKNENEQIINLPQKKKDTYYVISKEILSVQRILEARKDVSKEEIREDLLCPNELIRDMNGNIIGCIGLTTK